MLFSALLPSIFVFMLSIYRLPCLAAQQMPGLLTCQLLQHCPSVTLSGIRIAVRVAQILISLLAFDVSFIFLHVSFVDY